MFRKMPAHRPPVPAGAGSGSLDVAPDNQDPLLPVLTRAEILATVNLLEQYIQLTPDNPATDVAGTLIVRLLDRLHHLDDLAH